MAEDFEMERSDQHIKVHRAGGDGTPRHCYNPGFREPSLERFSALPLDDTEYVFSKYGYPNQRRQRDLSKGGTFKVHHMYEDDPDAIILQDDIQDEANEMSMENLLMKLPSRQLESAAINAAKTLHQRLSRKASRKGAGDLEGILDGELNAGDEEAMEDVIRSIPATLATRRSLVNKFSKNDRIAPSLYKRVKYNIEMEWKHLKEDLGELRYSLQLWHSHLKKIDGHFGSDVMSYFLFLKWLVLINIPTLLLTLGFIVCPQLLQRWLVQDPPGYLHNQRFSVLDLLTGTGWLSLTELYYGAYTNQSVSIVKGHHYQMELAYLFTCGGFYLLTLFELASSILTSYKKYYINTGGMQGIHVTFKALANWDFGLTSKEAVKLKHLSNFNAFKEYLGVLAQKKGSTRLSVVCQRFWLRVCTNLLVLGLCVGAGCSVYYLANYQLTVLYTNTNTNAFTHAPAQDIPRNPQDLLILPIVIGVLHLLLPFLFSVIESYEEYVKPKTELYVHLVRSLLLRVGTLAVLTYFWYVKVVATPSITCWETFLGQEIYRLVIVDFIFSLIGTFFSEFVLRLLADHFKQLNHPRFAIGRNTLDLVYAQALCWLGTYYMPLLPVVAILKLIIIFYVKMVSVLQNCKPTSRQWRASQTHTVYLGFLFLIFICSSIAVACGIIFIKPSEGCGPYKGKRTMYDVVPQLVASWEEGYPWLTQFINFVSSPGFITAVLVAMGTAAYLVRTVMVGRKESVGRLKQQLVLEGKDKTFLLNLLNQVSVRQSATLNMDDVTERPLLQTPSAMQQGHQFIRTVAESALGSK